MSDQAVREFWADFEQHRRALVEPVDPTAMTELLRALRRIDRRFYYHVREHDQGADLILSAEGHCDALPLLRRVRDAAPSLAGWKVLAVFDGDLAIGRRNTALFPEDENGDVLWRMARSGDDLCRERPIHFSVVFLSARGREEFLARLEEEGLEGRPEAESPAYEPFDVTVTKVMRPTHADVTAFEQRLLRLAGPLGGRNDGWGCFQQPRP